MLDNLVKLLYSKQINLDSVEYPIKIKRKQRALFVLSANEKKIAKDIQSSKFSFDYDILYMKDQNELSEDIFSITKKDLILGSIPKKNKLDALKEKAFGIFIDTQNDFNIASAIIGSKLGIPLRIGFCNESESPFYNIFFHGKSIKDFAEFWRDTTSVVE